ncbi:sulfotransferase domain-containing protein [Pelagicoccus sp. SDUM812002]|uniref:sulfotransferase domain-containing protein n=1 Tax=Pelagicoccus sp. SDUM812002 TaxID=3041266 RepID=UPI00280F0B87|nr:sulfotransferase domain-containing protein [Pelagicoccus sp. SDUM812002]MDQ8187865.1 sulfotransferase domain-containing protein [Pelagicoccus sp. SDUM812002]
MGNKLRSRISNFSQPAILKANYLLNNYREVIWLIGDGRSGTTWVSDMINHERKYREMFEPFHPKYVRSLSFISPHQYIRKDESNERLEQLTSKILSGKFTHPRIDSENRSFRYRGLLIKDIFANLLSHWATSKFPEVRPVMLLRNPFAVAISKYKKSDWYWAIEPRHLLNQKSLHNDYLQPFEEIIARVSDEKNHILNLILIWSVINYVPLRQFRPGEIHLCFYEHIYENPTLEIRKILQFVRRTKEKPKIKLPKAVIERPSRVIGNDSNLLSATSPISSWKNELTPKLIDEGQRILQCFGLDKLYDENSMPNAKELRAILESPDSSLDTQPRSGTSL